MYACTYNKYNNTKWLLMHAKTTHTHTHTDTDTPTHLQKLSAYLG